jgi:hypothetical protein
MDQFIAASVALCNAARGALTRAQVIARSRFRKTPSNPWSSKLLIEDSRDSGFSFFP